MDGWSGTHAPSGERASMGGCPPSRIQRQRMVDGAIAAARRSAVRWAACHAAAPCAARRLQRRDRRMPVRARCAAANRRGSGSRACARPVPVARSPAGCTKPTLRRLTCGRGGAVVGAEEAQPALLRQRVMRAHATEERRFQRKARRAAQDGDDPRPRRASVRRIPGAVSWEVASHGCITRHRRVGRRVLHVLSD